MVKVLVLASGVLMCAAGVEARTFIEKDIQCQQSLQVSFERVAQQVKFQVLVECLSIDNAGNTRTRTFDLATKLTTPQRNSLYAILNSIKGLVATSEAIPTPAVPEPTVTP